MLLHATLRSMPFANEHAARQTDPDQYDKFSRIHPDGFPAGIDAILGIKGGKSEIQSIRAKSADWTVAEFRAWLKEHDFKTSIEEATNKSPSDRLGELLPSELRFLHPFLTDDWQQCVAEHAQIDKVLLVLSPPDPDAVSPEMMTKAVADARAQWLLEAPDTAHALEAFAKVGRPFKLAEAPERLFCASFPTDGVEWADDTTAEKIAKLLDALPDEITIVKANDSDEGYVLGIVLEPEPFGGTGDAQGEVYSAKEVRKAAHRWVAEAQRLGLMHEQILEGAVLADSFVIPEESTGLTVGKMTIKPGTWLLGFYLDRSRPEWPAIKRGDFTGLSIGGMARRRPA